MNATETVTYEVCLLDFHGFYDSEHSQRFENAVNNMFEVTGNDDETEQREALEKFWEVFTFTRPMREAYCKMYVDILKEHLKDEAGLDLPSMTFKELISPREYNFSTDRIIVTINETDLETLKAALDKNRSDMVRLVRDLYTPVSGFIPFYPSDFAEWKDDVREWDHNELGTLLMALSGGWGDTELVANSVSINVSEEVDSIVYEHMNEEARKILDAYVKQQEEKINDSKV